MNKKNEDNKILKSILSRVCPHHDPIWWCFLLGLDARTDVGICSAKFLAGLGWLTYERSQRAFYSSSSLPSAAVPFVQDHPSKVSTIHVEKMVS